MPSTSLPVGKGLTGAQWQAWFAAFVKANPKVPRTYTGDNKTAKGKSWPDTYAVEQKTDPKATPDQVAQATMILIITEAIANGIDATAQADWKFPDIAVLSSIKGANAALASIPGVSQLASVESFLGALGSAALWIRVAKIAVGGTILIVGLVKLTGVDKQAGGIAAKAVKAAPLL